ncbi:hypothetical protein [Paenibacillus solani]
METIAAYHNTQKSPIPKDRNRRRLILYIVSNVPCAHGVWSGANSYG